MKVAVLTAMLVTMLVAGAGAQVLDIQVGQSANVASAPAMSVEGGFVTGGGDMGFGVRGNYKVSEQLGVFASVFMPEEGVAFGGGALYQLPLDLPVDLAARVALGYWSDSETFMGGSWDVTLLDFSALLVASSSLDQVVEGLGWYANAGLHYFSLSWDGDGFDDDDSEIGIQLGGGATFAITPAFTAFAGIDMITGDFYDEVYIGGGVRYGFGM